MKSIVTLLFLLASFGALAVPPGEEGKAIFTTRCGGCHNIGRDVVGPALGGVDQRHSIDWIVRFVQSSQTLVKAGDKEATAVFGKYNVVMPDHRDLTAENIRDVVEYIRQQASVAATSTHATPPAGSLLPLSIHNYWFFAAYFGMVALLVGVLLVFVRIKEYERSRA